MNILEVIGLVIYILISILMILYLIILCLAKIESILKGDSDE